MTIGMLVSHQPEIKIDGTKLDEAWFGELIELRVEQSIQVPDRMELRFDDADFEKFDSAKFKIGAAVDVSFSYESTVTPVIKVEVTSVALRQGLSGRHELEVIGLSKSHRMSRSTQVETYQNVKYSDIASTIAGRHGLSADVDATSITHDWVGQHDTDYAFLTELANRVGYDWWVNDGKLYFKKKRGETTGPELTFGLDLLRFQVRMAPEIADEILVHSWDPKTQKRIEGKSSPAQDINTVGASTKPQGTGKAAFGASTRVVGHFPVKDKAEADSLAESYGRMSRGDQVIARGVALGNPALKAGTKVKISGMGTRASGDYVLTSVEHVMGENAENNYEVRFQSGGVRAATIVDLLGSSATAGSGSNWSTRLGLVPGVVTNNDDPENLGRVKVFLPTLGATNEVGHHTDWARVVSPGATNTQGYMTVPEVNAEVLVGFEHGDIRTPIVLGGMWSAKNKPPFASTSDFLEGGKIVAYVLKTGAGHTLTIGKKGGKEQFELLHKDGKTLLKIAEDAVLINAESMPITITGKKAITVEATQDLTLKGQNIKLDAKQNIELKGTAKVLLKGPQIEAKADATLKLEGGATTELKSNGMLKAEASGIASFKGSMVMLG